MGRRTEEPQLLWARVTRPSSSSTPAPKTTAFELQSQQRIICHIGTAGIMPLPLEAVVQGLIHQEVQALGGLLVLVQPLCNPRGCPVGIIEPFPLPRAPALSSVAWARTL